MMSVSDSMTGVVTVGGLHSCWSCRVWCHYVDNVIGYEYKFKGLILPFKCSCIVVAAGLITVGLIAGSVVSVIIE